MICKLCKVRFRCLTDLFSHVQDHFLIIDRMAQESREKSRLQENAASGNISSPVTTSDSIGPAVATSDSIGSAVTSGAIGQAVATSGGEKQIDAVKTKVKTFQITPK